MASEAAALLDQLMGRARNAVPGEDGAPSERCWSDEDVCKHYLCGFCPSQLFTNTRSDVGPCDKVHDDALKKEYENSGKKWKMNYENEFLEYLEGLVGDLDKRIRRGRERLQRSADHKEKVFGRDSLFNSDRMKEISTRIDRLIVMSEMAGEDGRVEAAQEMMMEVEDLERERDNIRASIMSQSQSRTPQTLAGFEVDPGDFHEKNEICDVCGCFLVIGDTQVRVDAHLLGKQHLGFSRIRTAIIDLKQQQRDRWRQLQEEERKRYYRPRSRSRDRHRRHSHHRSRSRERNRHRSRSRSRSRERKKERRRSKSREGRSRRSRSREDRKSRRSHSREGRRSRRSTSREDKKRRRSHSREERRKRRSRSRDRDKKRKRSTSRDRKKRSRSRSQDKENGKQEGKGLISDRASSNGTTHEANDKGDKKEAKSEFNPVDISSSRVPPNEKQEVKESQSGQAPSEDVAGTS